MVLVRTGSRICGYDERLTIRPSNDLTTHLTYCFDMIEMTITGVCCRLYDPPSGFCQFLLRYVCGRVYCGVYPCRLIRRSLIGRKNVCTHLNVEPERKFLVSMFVAGTGCAI